MGIQIGSVGGNVTINKVQGDLIQAGRDVVVNKGQGGFAQAADQQQFLTEVENVRVLLRAVKSAVEAGCDSN